MTQARDKANIPVLNFASKGIDDNADATAITINSSEQVGIGVASSSYPLEINSSSQSTLLHLKATGATSAALTFANTGSNDSIAISAESDDLKLRTDDGNILFAVAENSEKMRITSAGLVGIGTSSPSTTLDVAPSGSDLIGLNIRGRSSDNKSRIEMRTNDNSAVQFQIESAPSSASYIKVVPNQPLIFRTNNSDKMTITGAGLVGIGTSSPATILHLNSSNPTMTVQHSGGTNQYIQIQQSGGASFLKPRNNTNDGELYVMGAVTGNTQAKFGPNLVQLYTANTERTRIHSNGVLSAVNGIALGVGTANTASNVLDDYEEGTWTPTFSGDGGNPSITYDTAKTAGSYIKIGRLVTVMCRIRTANASGGSGALAIAGLPFTNSQNSDANKNGNGVGAVSNWGSNTPLSLQMRVNTTQVALQYRTAIGGATAINSTSDLASGGNGNNIQFNLSYLTDA